MFGNAKKQVKEQEQELGRLKEEIKIQKQEYVELDDENRQAFARIEEENQKVSELIEGLTTEKKNCDTSLNRVVEYIKEIYASDLEQSQETERVLEEFKTLTEKCKTDREQCENISERFTEWYKGLEQQKQEEQVSLNKEPMCDILAEMGEEMTQLEGQLEQLEGLGHQMGVMSLNAAIEAGRMGESGRQFVAAAEEVRSCAGQYQEETRNVKAELERMKENMTALQKQVETLSEALEKQQNFWVQKMLEMKVYEEDMQEMKHAFPLEAWEELCEEGQRVAGIAEARKACFGHAMQSMELAGVSFMKEQQTLEQVEELLNNVQNIAEKQQRTRM